MSLRRWAVAGAAFIVVGALATGCDAEDSTGQASSTKPSAPASTASSAPVTLRPIPDCETMVRAFATEFLKTWSIYDPSGFPSPSPSPVEVSRTFCIIDAEFRESGLRGDIQIRLDRPDYRDGIDDPYFRQSLRMSAIGAFSTDCVPPEPLPTGSDPPGYFCVRRYSGNELSATVALIGRDGVAKASVTARYSGVTFDEAAQSAQRIANGIASRLLALIA